MKKNIGSIEDILSGEKGIESRWMKRRISPYNKVKEGDNIYFKYSTDKEIITVAKVSSVIQFELNQKKIKEIIENYGGRRKINLRNKNPLDLYYSDKKYCVLVLLGDAKRVEPFKISRKGYGTAWFCVENIDSLRVTTQ